MGSFNKEQQSPKPSIPQKPAAPVKPKTTFEENKEWDRNELINRMKKSSSSIPGTGGSTYSKDALKKMLGENLKTLMPSDKFQSKISETEAKKRLIELRHQEYIEQKDDRKKEISREKRWLEETWGLKGKY